jgi:nitroimidazol reductase NimA-like FMN-containing flavoprotein (pyridoxamine 5'-phosphate oxidase superfamily)
MAPEQEMRERLRELLQGQRLAVLSTHRGGQPYASLVAFSVSDDLRCLYFVTPRSTRKYANLSGDRRVALLISSSANRESDFHEAMAVTVLGSAGEIAGDEKQAAMARYLSRHPWLEDFARAPSCAMVRVAARSYILVRNFQQVMELHLEP